MKLPFKEGIAFELLLKPCSIAAGIATHATHTAIDLGFKQAGLNALVIIDDAVVDLNITLSLVGVVGQRIFELCKDTIPGEIV